MSSSASANRRARDRELALSLIDSGDVAHGLGHERHHHQGDGEREEHFEKAEAPGSARDEPRTYRHKPIVAGGRAQPSEVSAQSVASFFASEYERARSSPFAVEATTCSYVFRAAAFSPSARTRAREGAGERDRRGSTSRGARWPRQSHRSRASSSQRGNDRRAGIVRLLPLPLQSSSAPSPLPPTLPDACRASRESGTSREGAFHTRPASGPRGGSSQERFGRPLRRLPSPSKRLRSRDGFARWSSR